MDQKMRQRGSVVEEETMDVPMSEQDTREWRDPLTAERMNTLIAKAKDATPNISSLTINGKDYYDLDDLIAPVNDDGGPS